MKAKGTIMTPRRRTRVESVRKKVVAPPKTRLAPPPWAQRVLGVLGFGGMAIACVFLGVVDMARCVQALARGAPTASFQMMTAATVTLAVAFAMFGVMCMLPDPEIRLRPSRRSPAARMANRIGGRLFAIAGSACIATPLAPLTANLGLTWLAADHGYVRCPEYTIRRPTTHWALKAAGCPRAAP